MPWVPRRTNDSLTYHSNTSNKRKQIVLILTRRIGEKIIIGDSVTVEVLDVKGKQVRIGIEAPKQIEVHREEVYLDNEQRKRLAANNAA